MKNDYEIRGDVTVIFINSNKHGLQEALISTNKLDVVKSAVNSWTLSLNNKTKTFYVNGKSIESDFKKTILLHRLIMWFPEDKFIDHINHETLDNRDSNLRILTNQQNQQNRKGPASNNSSGVLGVNWHKHSGTWNVQLRVNGIRKSFGYFKSIEEAKSVIAEARRIHMPFAQ